MPYMQRRYKEYQLGGQNWVWYGMDPQQLQPAIAVPVPCVAVRVDLIPEEGDLQDIHHSTVGWLVISQ
jgi:hypothetical protein